jgi:hypothetical protein
MLRACPARARPSLGDAETTQTHDGISETHLCTSTSCVHSFECGSWVRRAGQCLGMIARFGKMVVCCMTGEQITAPRAGNVVGSGDAAARRLFCGLIGRAT